jgi:hypothetical protein
MAMENISFEKTNKKLFSIFVNCMDVFHVFYNYLFCSYTYWKI